MSYLSIAGLLVGLLMSSLSSVAAGQLGKSVSVVRSDRGSSQTLQFDVVSVRRNMSGRQSGSISMNPDGDGLTARNAPLNKLIAFAYDYRFGNYVQGMPEWAKNERYDVIAKIAVEDVTAYHRLAPRAQRAMLAAMMADRFHLEATIESRPMDVLALKLAPGTQRILPIAEKDLPTSPVGPNGESTHEDPVNIYRGKIVSEGIDMDTLALILTQQGFERPVVNQTGLFGRFAFTLHFRPQEESDRVGESGSSLESEPDIRTALPEELGLKLIPTKSNFPVLVVKHVEHPADN